MEHFFFVSYNLAIRGGMFDSGAAIAGHSTTGNKAIAKWAAKPFVGCTSYFSVIFVKKFLEPFQALIDNVQKLMKKLSTFFLAAKLQTYTTMTHQLFSMTRLSAVVRVLKQYAELLPHTWAINTLIWRF